MTPTEITTERGADYGRPRENFELTARYWSLWKGVEFTAEDVPMMMILVKMAREQHKHKDDNILDIQGYAETRKML